ncbi:MAG: hypothetical protein ACO3IN_13835, partial [Steroidobacteraceae bacterium]
MSQTMPTPDRQNIQSTATVARLGCARRTTVATLIATIVGTAATALPSAALAQDKVLNLYSARHYPTDEALYADFSK